jgi:NAD(P)-dependent dehydrogenase (short-subunit alcohol dehydrogenase family)
MLCGDGRVEVAAASEEHMAGNSQPGADIAQDMQDRVVLITGATSGIGLVTAEALARRGATVVMVARDAQRAEDHVQRIRATANNPRVTFLLADLSSLASVRAVAADFRARYPALHVLVNNAGAMFARRADTIDGYEMTFALDHLAPFLLTNLLLDELKASAPARVVTVSSGAHQGAHIDFDDLMYTRRRYSFMGAYGQAKLANVMFTYELARRLDGSGVTANALHPGFVATGFAKNNGPLYRVGMSVIRPFALTPERGAETSIYLASSPDAAGISGKYFAKCKPVASSVESYDQAAQRRLWEISEQLSHLTESVAPGIWEPEIR